MKLTRFEENGRIRLQRLPSIKWLFVWENGPHLKIFEGTHPDNRDSIHSYSLLNYRVPRAPMTQE